MEERYARERKEAAALEHARLMMLVPAVTRLHRDTASWLSLLPSALLDKVLVLPGWDGDFDAVVSGLRVRESEYNLDSIMQLVRKLKLIPKQMGKEQAWDPKISLMSDGITSTCIRLTVSCTNYGWPPIIQEYDFLLKLPPQDQQALGRGLASHAYLTENLFYARLVPKLSKLGPGLMVPTGSTKRGILPNVVANSYDFAFDDFVLVSKWLPDSTWSFGSLYNKIAPTAEGETAEDGADRPRRHPLNAVSLLSAYVALLHNYTEQDVTAADKEFEMVARRLSPSANTLTVCSHCTDSVSFFENLGVCLPRNIEQTVLLLVQREAEPLKHFVVRLIVESEITNRLDLTLCHGDLNPGNLAVSGEFPGQLSPVGLSAPFVLHEILSDSGLKTNYTPQVRKQRVCFVDWQTAHLGSALNCPDSPNAALWTYYNTHLAYKFKSKLPMKLSFPEMIVEYVQLIHGPHILNDHLMDAIDRSTCFRCTFISADLRQW